MAVRQLTLYDVLADLVPGSFLLVLAGAIVLTVTPRSLPLGTGLSGGLFFVIISYLVGRVVHAIAGQELVKQFRKWLVDRWIFDRNRGNEWDGYEPTVGEPAFRKYLRPGRTGQDPDGVAVTDRTGGFDRAIEESLPGLAAAEFREVSAVDVLEEPSEFRRFAYSYLFDSSTLYQRYNIQETFYRNLWLVSTLGSLASLVVLAGLVGSVLSGDATGAGGKALTLLLLAVGLFGSSVLFALRRIQFKYRQERALINDLYIHLTEDPDDTTSPNPR
jgi:hypothetical protein